MNKKLMYVSGLCLIFLVSIGMARADEIFTSTSGNGECCFKVDLSTVSANKIQVSVTLLGGATYFAGTGSGQHPAFAFNLSGDPSVTLSDYDTTKWTGSTSSVTTGGPAVGTFDYQFNLKSNGTSGGVSTLLFDVTNTSGIAFGDFDVNASGNYFVADFLGGNGRTGLGWIGSPGVVTVTTVTPEPSSLFLLGSGLIAFAGSLKRKLSSRT